MSRGAGVDVKICGLCRPEDARAASRAGATYLGVVFGPSPRRRTSAEARAIWGGVDGRRVGVFVDADVDVVRRLASDLELDVAQFHGSEGPGECARVRDAGIEVWKAVRMSNARMENREAGDGSALRAELERYADAVDGILLEGYSLRGHGGVGARLDWSLLEPVRAGWPAGVRLVLAGGLSPRNVARAIEIVRPDVVDVSSGVERRVGAKDEAAVRAFVAAARTAGAGR